MSDQPERRFWQIHLLTAVIAMAQAGALLPMFIEAYGSLQPGAYLFNVSAIALVILGVTALIVEIAAHHKWAQLLAGLVFVLLAGLIGRTVAIPLRIDSNQRRAIQACKALAEAEEIFHTTEFNCLHYARSLDALFNGDGHPPGPIWLIDASLAHAEYGTTPLVPRHGYLFKLLSAQGPHAPGGARDYVSRHDPPSPYDKEGKTDMRLGYAFVAFPSEYSATGKLSFIINNNGTIYEKDLGPNTTKLAIEMTEFDPDPSWTPTQ
jgi:hypothetical protein